MEAVGAPPRKLSTVYFLIGPTMDGGLAGMSLIINLGFTLSPWGRKAGRLIDAGRGSEIDSGRGPPLRSVGEGGGVGEGVEVFEGSGGLEKTGETDGEREFGVGGTSLSMGLVGISRRELIESAGAAACMS